MNKKTLLLAAILMIANFFTTHAQDATSYRYLVSASSGINMSSGSGISLGVVRNQKHVVSIGAGYGGFNAKTGVHYDYFFKNTLTGWSVGAGYSFSKAPTEVFSDSISSGKIGSTNMVLLKMQMKNAHLLNLQVKRTWKLYKSVRYYACTGYSKTLVPTYTELSDPAVTDGFMKSAFVRALPGGITLGAGIAIAIK
jgi:hypothetical protein